MVCAEFQLGEVAVQTEVAEVDFHGHGRLLRWDVDLAFYLSEIGAVGATLNGFSDAISDVEGFWQTEEDDDEHACVDTGQELEYPAPA